MSPDMAEMTLPVEEGGANIEPGAQVSGVIVDSDVKTFEHDGDEVSYYELTIREDETEIEFNPDWPARITPGTGLGQLLQRFDADLTVGAEIDLHEVFEAGMEVEFLVIEEEGDDSTFLAADESTVQPAGAGEIEADSSLDRDDTDVDDDEDDDEDDVRSEVLELVDGMEGEDESDVKKELAQEGGEYVQAFKSLTSDGDIEVDDGIVFLG